MAKLEKIKNIDYTIDFNENFDKKSLTKIYKQYGFVQVKNLLNSSLSKNLLSSALYFYKQNANKLGFFTRTKGELKQLDYFVRKLEKEDRDVAVCAQKLLASSSSMLEISNSEISLLASYLLNTNRMNLVFEGGGGFVPSIPGNKSRLYTYHSESHWIPMRKSFVNVWVPLFRRKKHKSGTMLIKPFSHLDRHEFYEYQGIDGNYNKSFYTQYEVIENNKYPSIAIGSMLNDVVFFHANVLHSSELNLSNNIGYLFNQRYFDTSLDRSISNIMGIRPYSNESLKMGRKLDHDFLGKF